MPKHGCCAALTSDPQNPAGGRARETGGGHHGAHRYGHHGDVAANASAMLNLMGIPQCQSMGAVQPRPQTLRTLQGQSAGSRGACRPGHKEDVAADASAMLKM